MKWLGGAAMNTQRTLTLIVSTMATGGSVHALGPPPPRPPIVVVVDMDPNTPGFQSSVSVTACTDVVQGIAIHIHGPPRTHEVWSIGYFGGIDRGIAFGHMVNNANAGEVIDITASTGTPVNPGNTPWVTPGFIPVFDGGEIHYLEVGASAPALVSPPPTPPVCTVTVALGNAHPGDQFRFFLLDYVTVWSGGTNGAFSVSGPVNTLDAGGDYEPDQTLTTMGFDPDKFIPSPPAPFIVDYIDGLDNIGGGAVIYILPKPGDITGDNVTSVPDLLEVINHWGRCPSPNLGGECPADLDGDDQIGVGDLLIVINNWGACSSAPPAN
jgi:hypothetical protein